MQFVQANGLRFAYLSEGSGPLVLLLHGFPDTAHTWDHVMTAVAKLGFRVVAPFMRGYHPTEIPKSGAYDAETLGRDVLALIEALGETQAIVVGHDWGALASYAAASLGPEHVRALVTVGVPHPNSIIPTPKALWMVRHFFVLRGKRAAEKARANDHAYIDALWRRWSPAWHDLPASETEHVKRAFAEPGCLEAACGYYAALSPFVPKFFKTKISVPTTTFAGLHDTIAVAPFEKARKCFSGPYEVVTVPGGHFMHRQHPDDFTNALVRVLQKI